MKTSLSALLFTAVAALTLVAPVRAADDDVPSLKKWPDKEKEKEFVSKLGEAAVKAVRTKPAKLELAKYEVTDPKPNRKVIDITMNWAGSLTGRKFVSKVKITVDPTDKTNWEVIDVTYEDDNPSLKVGMEANLKKLKEKLNR